MLKNLSKRSMVTYPWPLLIQIKGPTELASSVLMSRSLKLVPVEVGEGS
jgi:hypothetical protein